MTPQQLLQGAGPTNLRRTSTSQALQPAAPTNLPQANTLQVTGNPMNYSSFSGGRTNIPGVNTTQNTGNVNTGPSQAQMQAQMEAQRLAEEESKRSGLKSGISKLVNDTMGIYDTLFGNVSKAAQSQKNLLEQRFNRETGALGEQFASELPLIGQSFAGRGAYDSTWRTDAEARAQAGFQNQLADIGQQRAQAEAGIGSQLAEQEAGIGAGRSSINQILARLGEVTDINELTSLRNELENKINSLNQNVATTQSQEAFQNRFAQIAPTGDRMAQLSSALTNIIQGQAPAALKRSVAAQVIGSSGLSEDEKQQLISEVNTQIV
jgi:hypothetical protein